MSTTQENNPSPSAQTAVKKFQENTLDAVQSKISALMEAGDIRLPQNYSFENAVRSAWLHLQDQVDRNSTPVLDVCTPASISNAMLKMVVQGLSLVKGQCAFIAYGNKLTFQRQYQGSIALAKRVSTVKDVKANAIYEKDIFEFEVNSDTGIKKVTKHIQTLDSIDDDSVKGAYAVIELEDGTFEHEIMTIKQIRKSWAMGAANGSSPAHKNFAGEMACKTVINRACKLKISTSDDSDLFADGENDTPDIVGESVKTEIKQKAHKTPMTFEDAEIVTDKPAESLSNKQQESNPDALGKKESVVENKPAF